MAKATSKTIKMPTVKVRLVIIDGNRKLEPKRQLDSGLPIMQHDGLHRVLFELFEIPNDSSNEREPVLVRIIGVPAFSFHHHVVDSGMNGWVVCCSESPLVIVVFQSGMVMKSKG